MQQLVHEVLLIPVDVPALRSGSWIRGQQLPPCDSCLRPELMTYLPPSLPLFLLSFFLLCLHVPMCRCAYAHTQIHYAAYQAYNSRFQFIVWGKSRQELGAAGHITATANSREKLIISASVQLAASVTQSRAPNQGMVLPTCSVFFLYN